MNKLKSFVIFTLVGVLFFGLFYLGRDTVDEPIELAVVPVQQVQPETTSTTSTTTTVVSREITIDQPAQVVQKPERLDNAFQVGDALPLPDPKVLVNSLPYQFMNPEPAKQAWYIMTDVVLHWDRAKQDLWWPFAYDVMLGESGFCWNRLRGDVMQFPNLGCFQDRQGPHEDAGFGQVTSAWHGRNAYLCKEHGICGRHAVIADPWTSMYSMIVVMDHSGSQPWCFNESAIRYHKCRTLAPDRDY